MTDHAPLQGHLLVEVIRQGKHGPVVVRRAVHPNLVVNSGKRSMMRMLSGLAGGHFKFGRAGSSVATPASGDTNVQTPITGTLKTVDSITMQGRSLVIVWSYPSGPSSKSGGFNEAVVLNQRTSPGGSALCRVLISPPAAKTTHDKLRLTYILRAV